MSQRQPISRDEVLYAFAVEDHAGRDTLMHYLATYPQYALDLIDLSRELARTVPVEPFSEADERRVDAAVARFQAGVAKRVPVTLVPPKAFNSAAVRLQLPLLAMVAFRERRVDITSVPARFLERLAQALETNLDELREFLAQPPMVSAARQSKSRVKPVAPIKVPFDKVLRDAGVDSERILTLIDLGE